MNEIKVRTLDEAVKSVVDLIGKMTDESREDVNTCAKELFKLTCEEDSMKGLIRSMDITLAQYEVDRRTRFIDALTNFVKNYLVEYEGYSA